MNRVPGGGSWARLKARMTRRMSIGGGEALHHARLMILPTPFGLFWAVLVVLLLLLGINYENSLAHGLAFWLFSLALISIFRSWRNLAGVRVKLAADGEAYAGGELRLVVRLSGRLRAHAIDVRLGDSKQRLEIHAGEGSAPLGLSVAVRGQFTLPTLTLESRWPLGLVRLWAWVAIDMPVLIYPQPELSSAPQGSRRTLEQVEQGDFAGLRRYVPGDAPSHIAWKHWGRSGELVTKRFETPARPSLWLDYEACRGDMEQRLGELTARVLAAEEAQATYGLRLPGQTLSIASGGAHRHRALEALALFGGERVLPWSAQQLAVAERGRPGRGAT
ncbi:DUF58 domain-containing protein [Cobetia crustatorum]|uniref:DUF58 domain-containing protein n=3 Tax=Cobetia crustatorum TaxID=553385 RepID=A0A558HDM5_9GAMM|nr:DUF58 domain-containing protein [Cobetia crustatorum]